MGMRTHKHAIVVVLPGGASAGDVQERHVAAMERAVREYVTMAPYLQPKSSASSSDNTDLAHEATRLLVSLNVVVGNGDHVEMARAVAISGHAGHASRQLGRNLEEEIKKWRQQRQRVSARVNTDGRDAAFVRLLDELVTQQFNVSVLSPADSLPVHDGSQLGHVLHQHQQQQTKIQFVVLRDEHEHSELASKNVLELLRAIKSCGRSRKCTIRQVEDCEVELQGVVKEWLHAAAPIVCAKLQLRERDESPLELEIRANFVSFTLADGGVLSPWTALQSHVSNLRLMHFVPLTTVHPALLVGCPLRASASQSSLVQVRALSKFLCETRLGALVSCSRTNEIQDFYLLVSNPGSRVSSGLLMYRVASAEEILFPEADTKEGSTTRAEKKNEDDQDRVAAEIERLRELPIQEFNPFRNRSGLLSTTFPQTNDSQNAAPKAAVRSSSVQLKLPRSDPLRSHRSPLPTTKRGHGTASGGVPVSKRKKRL